MTSLIITHYSPTPEFVDMTNQALESLKFGRPDEVIVVDDASVVKGKFPLADRVIRRKINGGFPKCSNTGFKAAKGDILILSNNDVKYGSGWLEAILKPLENGYDISSLRMSDSDGFATENKITDGDRFGSLWAMKRKVFETIGGFDESFNKGTFEDLDFHNRAVEAGFKIGKNHAVVVQHTGRATMDKLYPDRQDFTEGKEHYFKKYGRLE